MLAAERDQFLGELQILQKRPVLGFVIARASDEWPLATLHGTFRVPVDKIG